MPLLARKKMYKTLPQCLADRVAQKSQNKSISVTTVLDRTLEDVEVARTTLKSGKEGLNKSHMMPPTDYCGSMMSYRLRPRTPLATISDESDNDTSSNQSFAGTPSPRGTPSPLLINQQPATVEDTKQDELNSTLELLMRPLPRFTRTSPRMTVSLDNVDLWEESDTESESTPRDAKTGFDRINGIVINPGKTFDFSELRRSRSPVVIERNVEGINSDLRKSQLPKREVASGKQLTRPGNEDSLKRPRARMPRKVKVVPHKEVSNYCVKENCSQKPSLSNCLDTDAGLNSSGESQIKVLKCSSSQDDATDKPQQPETDDVASSDKVNNQPARQRRRVKFNQLVTVKDGEVSSKEVLRSSNNSANLIKKKYLSGYRPKTAPSRTDPGTESPWRATTPQLAF